MKKFLIIIAGVSAISIAALVSVVSQREPVLSQTQTQTEANRSALPDSSYKHAAIHIGTASFDALVADTAALREQGLSDRDGLASGQAMLFVFPTPDIVGFWMKDMRFSLDMIWIGVDGRIVWIERDVSPATYPHAFFPPRPAKYVVEVPAGTADAVGAAVGSAMEMPYASASADAGGK